MFFIRFIMKYMLFLVVCVVSVSAGLWKEDDSIFEAIYRSEVPSLKDVSQYLSRISTLADGTVKDTIVKACTMFYQDYMDQNPRHGLISAIAKLKKAEYMLTGNE